MPPLSPSAPLELPAARSASHWFPRETLRHVGARAVTLLPVAHRELLSLCRRPSLYRWRATTAFLLAGLCLVIFLSTPDKTALGQSLFNLCTVLGTGLCLVAGPFLTSDALSEEKRNGTLGLLFLTNLRGHDVVAGKFVGLSMPALHSLLAVFPVLTMAIFLGGLTGGELARTSLALLNLAFLSLALGLLCSSLCANGHVAMAGSLFGLVLLCTVGPLVEVNFQTLALVSPPAFAWPCPAYPLLLARDAWHFATGSAFWRILLQCHALGWLALAVAALVTPRSWQDRGADSPGTSRGAVSGNGEAARRWQQHRWLLEVNPLIWLARRLGGRFGSALWPVVLVATGAGVMAWMWDIENRLAPATSLPFPLALVITYLVHGGVKLWLLWTAVRLASEDRRSGALELLVVTPLHENDLWLGWVAALKRRYLWAVMLLVGADLFLLIYFVVADPDTHWFLDHGVLTMSALIALLAFLADCYALTWMGLWQGLTARSAPRAFARSVALVLGLPLVCGFLFFMPFSGRFWYDETRLAAIVWVWAATSWVADLAFCLIVMNRVAYRLRAAVVGDTR